MHASGREFKEHADYYADVLIGRILDCTITVNQLRLGLSWANALDAEATRLGVNLDIDDADGEEALARRLAHHAGRSALNSIGTSRKLNTTRARYSAVSKKYLL